MTEEVKENICDYCGEPCEVWETIPVQIFRLEGITMIPKIAIAKKCADCRGWPCER